MDYISQGSRIFLSGWKSRMFPKHYSGTAEEIGHKIIRDCWNGRFFQTSTTNFPQFWTRDFGWCVQSLLKLGYNKEVQQTLRYAMNRFRKYKQVTTTLTPGGKAFNFPVEAVDSLPWFIHALRIAKFPYYDFKDFLNLQIKNYFEEIVDRNTGLVRSDKYFSSIKDFALRRSSCYDNCMVALLASDLDKMKLYNPLVNYNYPELISKNFWNGSYFYDDLERKRYVSGDANVFPFLLGVITDVEMLQLAIKSIQKAELDQPFPLKYTSNREHSRFIWQEMFLKNYESDSIWMHIGPLYVRMVKEVDQTLAQYYKERYRKLILLHKNFMEVFAANGNPFKTKFYHSDSGMLWVANYLTL